MRDLSDDTQLTLATCEAIIESQSITPETAAEKFLIWFSSGKVTGMGVSTLKAMRDLQSGAHWALSGRSGERAAGNGAAMRIAPVAFFLDPFDFNNRQMIRDLCRITHNNDEAYAGALAVLMAIRLSIINKWDMLENPLLTVAENLFDCNVKDRLMEFASDSDRSILEVGRLYGAGGYVVDSVPVSLYGAFKSRTLGFKRTMEELIQVGDDTDTVCSIAGQIMGASAGFSNIQKSLSDNVPHRDFILEISDALSEISL